jgi:hypothetical protein
LELVKPSSTRLFSRFVSQVGDDFRNRTAKLPELAERKRTETRDVLVGVVFVVRLVATVPPFLSGYKVQLGLERAFPQPHASFKIQIT